VKGLILVEVARIQVPDSLDKQRRKKSPSKFNLLLNKRWNPLPPAMINDPGTGVLCAPKRLWENPLHGWWVITDQCTID
jgi:hypothetical protein